MNHTAFYISQPEAGETAEESTNLKDFLLHVDSALAWRTTYSDHEFDKLTTKPKIKVFMQPELDLDLEFKPEDEMECEVEVAKGTELINAMSHVSVFDAPPPTFPLRIVIAVFELQSENEVNVFFHGNAHPFQHGFQKLKIKGQSYKADAKQDRGTKMTNLTLLKLLLYYAVVHKDLRRIDLSGRP